MKKVLTILIGILCTLATYAVTYASPYKGQGRGVYTFAGYGRQAYGAQAPTTTMGSTSSYRGMNTTTTSTLTVANPMPVRGIYTSASSIQGGVTTYDAGESPHRAPGRSRNASWPDNPDDSPDCGCHWVDSGDGETYVCPICGHIWNEYDDAGRDHCHCVEESGSCRCPLDFSWGVALFMAASAAAYALKKKRAQATEPVLS
ncbi:MAG: hypothetical protein SPK97_03745 [Bacteroidales bacterium]|nr:hypothetical protein [Bacteroidales bacterium]